MYYRDQRRKDNYQMDELKSNNDVFGSDKDGYELCPDCHGSGSLQDNTCGSCNGKGLI